MKKKYSIKNYPLFFLEFLVSTFNTNILRKKSILTIIVTAFSFSIILPTNAEELTLPSKEFKAPLSTTSEKTLGTNDDGVGLTKGQSFEAFSIKTHTGKRISSTELLNEAPLLVIFYRGGWCPFCNVQIRQLTEAYPEFEKRNVTPVLISVDETDGASLAQKTYDIPFPVLSDSDLLAHNAFNVIMAVDEKTTALYKKMGIDLEKWSQRDHHSIAVSSAFLVDKNGIVLWAHTSKDYKTRPSPAQLLDVIDKTLSH